MIHVLWWLNNFLWNVCIYHTTWHHIPEDSNLYRLLCFSFFLRQTNTRMYLCWNLYNFDDGKLLLYCHPFSNGESEYHCDSSTVRDHHSWLEFRTSSLGCGHMGLRGTPHHWQGKCYMCYNYCVSRNVTVTWGCVAGTLPPLKYFVC